MTNRLKANGCNIGMKKHSISKKVIFWASQNSEFSEKKVHSGTLDKYVKRPWCLLLSLLWINFTNNLFKICSLIGNPLLTQIIAEPGVGKLLPSRCCFLYIGHILGRWPSMLDILRQKSFNIKSQLPLFHYEEVFQILRTREITNLAQRGSCPPPQWRRFAIYTQWDLFLLDR